MIISQDTVWTADSVRNLDSEVVEIATGVTLRIAAGATVNGGVFHAYGRLDIDGAADSQVVLNNVSIGTRGYDGRVDVDHARMTGGEFFSPTGGGNAATFSLTNSIFDGVNAGSNGWTMAYVWYSEGPVLIQGNSFVGSGGFSIGNQAGGASTIRNNSFASWIGDFAVQNWAAYGGSATVVEGNVFLDAGRVALELPLGGYDQAAMTAERNYFGTTDPTVIAAMILDRADNPDRASFIDYQPYLTYAPFGTHLADSLSGTARADSMRGLDGNDTLNGANGNDTLAGGSGDDSLVGGAGADSMAGGAGDDTYSVDNAGDVVSESTSGGDDGRDDLVRSSVTFTLGTFLEGLVLTGAATIDGTGNNGANVITGNGRANVIAGLDGDDTLDGGAGADTLFGGLGDDLLIYDGPEDVLVELSSQGIDTVHAPVSYSLGAYIENLVLLTNTPAAAIGNNLANLIIGNGGHNMMAGGGRDDTLAGNDGNDSLNGGAGADSMAGGLGDDRYSVDDAGDLLLEQEGEGQDIVVASIDWTLAPHFENLTLASGFANLAGTGNNAADRITGNQGDNLLRGAGGRDVLMGGDGDDTLLGGLGDDVLNGGAGADHFRFVTSVEGLDRIVDFQPGTDVLELVAAGFDGMAVGDLPAASFVARSGNGATSGAGVPQFVYNIGTGLLLFDADGAGGAAAFRMATLRGAPGLSAADIVLI